MTVNTQKALALTAPVDILLVQPPIRDFYLTAKRTLPGGLISIAAVLRAEGFKVGLLDALARGKSRPLDLPRGWQDLAGLYGPDDQSPFALFNRYRHFGYSLQSLGDAMRGSGAFLIGISSLFSPYEEMALATAEIAKASCPDATIVLGGHHPTALPERLLAHPAVDCVLRGDGEATLPLLAHALVHRRPLEKVPGIGMKRTDGRRHLTPPAYVEDLNQLPPPAFDLVDASRYARNHLSSLLVTTSRGCPLDCTYCCTGAASGIPYRRRTVDHVMHEIARAADHMKIGFIDFEDENISLKRDWFLSLLDAIHRFFGAAPPELRAMNGLHPATLDERIIARMRPAGFKTLNLSVGTFDAGQQQRFRRPDLRAHFDRALTAAGRHGLTAVGYLIAGSPGQRAHSVVDDLLALARRRVLAALSIFYPAPGSRDFDWCRRHDRLPEDIARWRSTALPMGAAPDRLASTTLLRLTRILNFMKACLDQDGEIPMPAPVRVENFDTTGDRFAKGRHLLQGFLYDGKIRGFDRQGRIFAHRADEELADRFRAGLDAGSIQGARRGCRKVG
ncbi:MAG: radical SAM protein [Desulfobacterales bacterium]|nr:radical SAM protein [Desulfobacterales bacterium]MDJ0884989.1 radical SAM protein [Desulfobacterales bacterium]